MRASNFFETRIIRKKHFWLTLVLVRVIISHNLSYSLMHNRIDVKAASHLAEMIRANVHLGEIK